MKKGKEKRALREKRHRRVRKMVEGTPEKPRLCVSRSDQHIYAQVVDDWNQHTLVACSTLSPEVRETVEKSNTVDGAARVGELVAQRCLEEDIGAVVFDRGGYKYHGRVKALAEAARKKFEEAGAEGF